MKVRHLFGVLFVLLTAGLTARASDETEYFAVFMEGKKVGYSVMSRAVSGGKVTTTAKTSITVSRLNIPVSMTMSETNIETVDGKPLAFESVQELAGIPIKMTGTIDEQGVVNLKSTSMGAEQKATFEWPDGALMAEGLRLLHLAKGLKEGSAYTANVFSPSIAQAIETRMEVGAKESVDLLGRVVALTKVTSTINLPGTGVVVSTSYVDDDLHIQKNITPLMGMQIEMVACAREFALGENDVLDVIDKMFLASPRSLEDIGSIKSISYLLKPVSETTDLVVPASDNQRVRKLENGSVIVVVMPVAVPRGARFPYRGRDEAIRQAMKPTRFLQSDDRKVIELARRAVGNTKDAAEAARRIEAFVATYVDNRSLSVGYASAAEVAASKQGDCSEFAVLTAAMCRAVGIPAQVVVGVAYVKDFASIEGFGGHAWTQAYVGRDSNSRQSGKWVCLDSAFKGAGLGGYGAGHIALAVGNGNPEDFFDLVSTLGQFKIAKIMVDKDR